MWSSSASVKSVEYFPDFCTNFIICYFCYSSLPMSVIKFRVKLFIYCAVIASTKEIYVFIGYCLLISRIMQKDRFSQNLVEGRHVGRGRNEYIMFIILITLRLD